MRRKRRSKRSKVVPGIIISLCTLIIVYLAMTMYFKNHFYFGTVVNGINISGETVEDIQNELYSKIENYTLELEERGDTKETISADDIGLSYDKNKIAQLKEKQNSTNWLLSIFNKKDPMMAEIITYDEEALNKAISNLSCLNGKNVIEPENASFKYNGDSYEIIDEINGTKINKDALFEAIKEAVVNSKQLINLDKENCYEKPKYTSKSSEVLDVKKQLDLYTDLTITYKSGDNTEILDGDIINNWLEVNDNMEIIFNEDKIKNYVYKISSTYNTFGNTRDFMTSSKTNVKVSGGNYGWIVDNSKEVKEIIEAVKNGQSITKEPAYSQKAISREANDIGNTYVEINMTKQHLWFYKDGVLVVEGDVVTGNASTNTLTPAGTYVLNYKEKNATLKGEDYSSPVSYWMPFNGNIGIHDASWRTEFGKNIYLTNGSHGCVNSPFELAKTIFENIQAGTPIVCYYE